MPRLIPCLVCLFSSLIFLGAKTFHPVDKINEWLKEEHGTSRSHVFATLATVDLSHQPYTRMVELTTINRKKGIVFFTHKKSSKVEHLRFNPHAALNIYLPKIESQISLKGNVSSLSVEKVAKAWKRMPKFMQISFLLSDHGRESVSLKELNKRKKELQSRYKKREIPPPSAFVGYTFHPSEVIFFKVRKRNFPLKEIATLQAEENWTISLVDP